MTDTSLTTISPPGTVQAQRNAGAGFWPSAIAVARRTVRKFVRTPQLIVYSSIQSALFLLIFRYVFGGAIDVGGLPYVDFLVPGFIVTGVVFAGMGAAAGVAEDVEQGLFDRLRSLPIRRASVVAGRGLADTALVTWGLLIAAALGFAVGFRLHGSVAAALAAFGLCVLFGFAFSWVFITIGLLAGNAQAAQGMSMIVSPLVFASSAYVPVSSMPPAGCRRSATTNRSRPWSTRCARSPGAPRWRRCSATAAATTSGCRSSGQRRSSSSSGCSRSCASHGAEHWQTLRASVRRRSPHAVTAAGDAPAADHEPATTAGMVESGDVHRKVPRTGG
jgi:ABC-2 type transport system permease protein